MATPEQSAESVSFRRHQAELPPEQNVISVAVAELSAGQFGGSIAKSATFVHFANIAPIDCL